MEPKFIRHTCFPSFRAGERWTLRTITDHPRTFTGLKRAFTGNGFLRATLGFREYFLKSAPHPPSVEREKSWTFRSDFSSAKILSMNTHNIIYGIGASANRRVYRYKPKSVPEPEHLRVYRNLSPNTSECTGTRTPESAPEPEHLRAHRHPNT